MPALPWRRIFLTFAGFALVATLQSWPLPLRMSTHLTGHPGGDAGVYVWNTWLFRHEIVDHHQWPFSTNAVMPLDGPTDLSLHNYTPFADLLALPLQPLFGVVATFNLIYLFNVALAGFGVFLLAYRVTKGRYWESCLAGVLFACSPFMVARSLAHFSLVAAAPIPFFLYWMDRAWTSARLRDALAAGGCVAWAWACDPYYAVYCLMLGALFVAGKLIWISAQQKAAIGSGRWRRTIDVLIGVSCALILGVHVIGGGAVRVGPITITMRTLYTPVLVLCALVLLRLALTIRLDFSRLPRPQLRPRLRLLIVTAALLAVIISPQLLAMGQRVLAEGSFGAPVLWRSSAPGIDLVSFIAPNPAHPLAPASLVQWLDSQPGFLPDQVASVPLVAIGVFALAWWRGFRPGRFWPAVAVLFGWMALGPFVHVAGMNTYLPTPWTLLRYLPVVGAARIPARFTAVALVGVAILFAMALAWLTRNQPLRARRILVAVAVLLAFELLPAPRHLYSAAIPGVYRVIAADPRSIRVLELPTGIRDGVSSIGDFSASASYYQTMHGKPIIGGYLSRVPQACKTFYRRQPVMSALITLSEGGALEPRQAARARAAANGFLDRADLGYVVMNTSRVTTDLRDFAIALFGLDLIESSDGYELYAPRAALPPIQTRPGRN